VKQNQSNIDLNRMPRLRRRLLKWYQRNHRDLPWRRTKDPYRIWVSEIMLQQTQVPTVVPYYRRFLRRFPTVRTVAQAPLGEVLKGWEGLGYYARARHLHAAAKRMVEQYRGRVPDTLEALTGLPGIARSTAGSILSIAYGKRAPILDGNVKRVLCRLFNVAEDLNASRTVEKLWEISRRLVPRKAPGIFNQALMDLGATICIPKKPKCGACCWADLCEAWRLNLQEQLPVKSRKPAIPHREAAVGVIWKNGKVLIARRPPEGLLGGLWEFPGGQRHGDESLQECLRREVKEEVGIDVEIREPMVTVRHAYSHFKVTLHVFRCRYRSGKPQALDCADWKWVRPEELSKYPFPAANHKIIERILGT